MSELNIGLATVGGVVIAFGLVSRWLRRFSISEPLLAVLVGVLLSPEVFGLLDPARWGEPPVIMHETARLTLGIGLMAVALRVPRGFPFAVWRSLGVLLTLGMLFMWLSSSLLVSLVLGLPTWVALLVGAVVTPTDPVVAASIVTGTPAQEHVPYRLRHLIASESGANDGLAYPFVLLPVLWLTRPSGEALQEWLLHVVVGEVGGAVLLGTLLGSAAGWLLHHAEQRQTIERPSFLAAALALALLALAAGRLLGTNGVLAVFVTGVAFHTFISGVERSRDERVMEAVDRLFLLPVFVLLGLTLPWERWLALGWPGLALVLAVLVLRRLPGILALTPLIPRLHSLPEALYVGWFGPIGVAALFYAMLAKQRTGLDEPWVVGSLLVCASLVAHGLTATPLTLLLGRHERRRHRTGRHDHANAR